MAVNAWYPLGLAAIGEGTIGLTDTLNLTCVDDTYTFSTAHDNISDLSAVTIGPDEAVAGATEMVGRTLTTDEAVTTIPSVPVDANDVAAIVLSHDSTGALLHIWFNSGDVPIVVVTDNGDVEVEFVEETDTGLFGIVRI